MSLFKMRFRREKNRPAEPFQRRGSYRSDFYENDFYDDSYEENINSAPEDLQRKSGGHFLPPDERQRFEASPPRPSFLSGRRAQTSEAPRRETPSMTFGEPGRTPGRDIGHDPRLGGEQLTGRFAPDPRQNIRQAPRQDPRQDPRQGMRYDVPAHRAYEAEYEEYEEEENFSPPSFAAQEAPPYHTGQSAYQSAHWNGREERQDPRYDQRHSQRPRDNGEYGEDERRYRPMQERPRGNSEGLRGERSAPPHGGNRGEDWYGNDSPQNLAFWNNKRRAEESYEREGAPYDRSRSPDYEWEERHSPLRFILIIAALIIASSFGWFLYRWFSTSLSVPPPFIQGEPGPFRVYPENAPPPHQELIYNRISPSTVAQGGNPNGSPEGAQGADVERVLPAPENPVYPGQNIQRTPQIVGQGQPSAAQPAAATSGPVVIKGLPPSLQGPQVVRQPTSPGGMVLPMPETVPHGMTGGTTGGMTNGENLPVAPAEGAVRPGEPSLQFATPSAPKDEEDIQDLDQLIARETGQPVEKIASAQTSNVHNTVPLQETYRIQLATLKSKTEADNEWKRLLTLQPGVFGNMKHAIEPNSSQGKKATSYRLVVGSFSNHSQAHAFSKKLGKLRLKTLVVPPSPKVIIP